MMHPEKCPNWVQEIIFNNLIDYIDRMRVSVSSNYATAYVYSQGTLMLTYELDKRYMSYRQV